MAAARRRKGEKIDGWLVLDKPLGLSSAAAVARVKRLFGAAKAGHAGTLDPLATGVLPVALGEATKTVRFVMDGAKTYRFTVRWGEARATDDAEGEVTGTSAARPSEAAIAAMLPRFTGEIAQVPPVYSALKLGGRPAYARARAGETPALAARRVRVDRFVLEACPDPDHARFTVQCGKGVYIRSLARDLAQALGTLGHVAELRRTAVGKFGEALAIPLDLLDALGHSAARFGYLRPVETALDDIPALAVTDSDCRRLRQGQKVEISRTAEPPTVGLGGLVRATHAGRVVALARVDGDSLKPVRVLNLEPGSPGEPD